MIPLPLTATTSDWPLLTFTFSVGGVSDSDVRLVAARLERELREAEFAAEAKRNANRLRAQQRGKGAPAPCRRACRPQLERRPAATRPHQRGQGCR